MCLLIILIVKISNNSDQDRLVKYAGKQLSKIHEKI